MKKIRAFTLTEVLIAIVIVGLLAALVLPILIQHFQDNAFTKMYTRQVNTISDAVDALPVAENKASFFETMMFKENATTDYSSTSGEFMKKYLRIAKDCGSSNGNCFAKTYYEYKNRDKVVYTPEYKGYCATLKNGVSICMTHQYPEGNTINQIEGIMDLNGPKGPNIKDKDLRTFKLNAKIKEAHNKEAGVVYSEPPYLVDPQEPPCTSCDCDPAFCDPEPSHPTPHGPGDLDKDPNFVLQYEVWFTPGYRTYDSSCNRTYNHTCRWNYWVEREYNYGDYWTFLLRDTNESMNFIDSPIRVDITYNLTVGVDGCITNVTGYRGKMSVTETILNITPSSGQDSVIDSSRAISDDMALEAFVKKYNWNPSQCQNPELVAREDFWVDGISCELHYDGKYNIQLVQKAGNVACTLK